MDVPLITLQFRCVCNLHGCGNNKFGYIGPDVQHIYQQVIYTQERHLWRTSPYLHLLNSLFLIAIGLLLLYSDPQDLNSAYHPRSKYIAWAYSENKINHFKIFVFCYEQTIVYYRFSINLLISLIKIYMYKCISHEATASINSTIKINKPPQSTALSDKEQAGGCYWWYIHNSVNCHVSGCSFQNIIYVYKCRMGT